MAGRRKPRVAQRRRRKIRRPRSSRAVLPPARTIMGHIMREVVQTAWDIAQGALSVSTSTKSPFVSISTHTPVAATDSPTHWDSGNMNDGWLFAQGWIDRFKGLFREYKVHKITAHYMPYESPMSPREYVFCLWDEGENEGTSSFFSGIGAPASVVRKSGTPSRLVWIPTEPEDRNWHPFGDSHEWCRATVASSEARYRDAPPGMSQGSVAGKIIIEVDASFRGKPSAPRSSSPYGSLEFRDYSRSIRCVCSRCLRRLLNSKTLPDIDFPTDEGMD